MRQTQYLPWETKTAVRELLDNSNVVKSLIERPRDRNLQAYVNSFNARANTHEVLVKKLFKQLAIPDTVEVRLLSPR